MHYAREAFSISQLLNVTSIIKELFLSVKMTFLCLLLSLYCFFFRSKEHVETTRFSHRHSGESNHGGDIEAAGSHPASDTISNSQHPNATLTNHNEEKRSHTQCNFLKLLQNKSEFCAIFLKL